MIALIKRLWNLHVHRRFFETPLERNFRMAGELDASPAAKALYYADSLRALGFAYQVTMFRDWLTDEPRYAVNVHGTYYEPASGFVTDEPRRIGKIRMPQSVDDFETWAETRGLL